MTIDDARRLATATLECALLDASGSRQSDRAHALAWLASRQAQPFLDLLDLDQLALLESSGWLDWASETLQDPSPEVSPAHLECIQTSYHYLVAG